MSIKGSLFVLLAAVFLLTGCRAPQSDESTFVESTRGLPGEQVYLTGELPSSFGSALNKVYQAHQAGKDIWLFASEDVLQTMDSSGDFRAWLRATRPLLFDVETEPVYFIPADRKMNELSFVLDHHLEKWVDRRQLAQLWQARGDDLRSEREFEAAIEAYEQALSLDPELVDAHVGMGAALLGVGENDRALKSLLLATALDPQNYWAQRLLGSAYLNLRRYGLAVAPLTRAYLLRPEQSQALIGVALALGRSGRKDMALRVLDEATLRSDIPKVKDDINTLRTEFGRGGD